MFEGHQLYKIGNGWVFDLTEFIGYKVKLDGMDKVVGYQRAFKITKTSDGYMHNKYISVPSGIIRKSLAVVKNYKREAFLEYDGK